MEAKRCEFPKTDADLTRADKDIETVRAAPLKNNIRRFVTQGDALGIALPWYGVPSGH